MRCLNCHFDGVEPETPVCPSCGVVFATLFRDMLPPKTLLDGRYEIEYVLGQGGFGITYLAMHSQLGKRVAIKEYYPAERVARNTTTWGLLIGTNQQADFQRGLKRFVEEGQKLEQLEHPNVVRVRDLFSERGTAYLVMEYLSGRSLREELKVAAAPEKQQGPLPEERVRQIMGALVEALAAVHQQGLQHLDIKPDNVMVENSGRVVLIDFGASRRGMGTTSTRAFTQGYAPPELTSEAMEVGPQSDIFEMGVMLHELLTGNLPAMDVTTRLIRGEKSWAPADMSEPWKSLIEQSLRLEMQARPPDIHEWWQLAQYKPTRGADDWAEVQITEEEARLGGHKAYVSQGLQQGVVEIPPRTRSGAVITEAGNGLPGLHGGAAGDMKVKVIVQRPARPARSAGTSRPATPPRPAASTPKVEKSPKTIPAWAIGALLVLLLVVGGILLKSRTASPSSPNSSGKTTPTAVPGNTEIASPTKAPVDVAALNKQLLTAIAKHNVPGAKTALQQGALINSANKDGETALLLASISQHPATVQVLLDAKANTRLTDSDGITPLIACAMQGDAETMRLLLKADGDSKFVNAQTKTNGYSALMRASARGEVNMVRLLLAQGANKSLKSKRGLMARDFTDNAQVLTLLK